MKEEEMPRVKLFIEDDCLQHDPTYPGAKGWWKDTFVDSFDDHWNSAVSTEEDFGDSFHRKVTVKGRNIVIISSYDGISIYEDKAE